MSSNGELDSCKKRKKKKVENDGSGLERSTIAKCNEKNKIYKEGKMEWEI